MSLLAARRRLEGCQVSPPGAGGWPDELGQSSNAAAPLPAHPLSDPVPGTSSGAPVSRVPPQVSI